MRFAARKDNTQAEVVAGLRAHGYQVEIIGRPVDLAVRDPSWRNGIFVLMETKTPNRKNGYKPRKDQQAQQTFCERHGVPYIESSQRALDWLSANYLRSTVPLPGGRQ